jgi:hypothetical protein
MLTIQQTYDKMLNGLRVQGKPSIEDDFCMYRSKDGCRCAIGQIIDDQHYNRFLEGCIYAFSTVATALALSGINIENEDIGRMLFKAQDAHDSWHGQGRFIDHIEKRFEAIANEFHLSYTKAP